MAISRTQGDQLRRYVGAWVAVAVLGLVAAVIGSVVPAPWPPTRVGEPWLLAVVAVVALVISLTPVHILSKDVEHHEIAEEASLVLAIVLLQPGWALMVVVGAAAVAEVIERRLLIKKLYNLANPTLASLAAVAVYDVLAPADPFGGPGIGVVATALLTYLAVNWVGLAGLTLRLGGATTWLQALRGGLEARGVIAVTTGAIGLVGAYLLVEAPLLAPLLAAPLVVVRHRVHQRRRTELARLEDHERLQRTVAGASDGIALLDEIGRVEVWNPAIARLTGVPRDAALARPVEDVLRLVDDRDAVVGLAGADASEPRVLVRADGQRRTVRIDVSPVGAPGGRSSASVLVVRDVTAEVELERMREDLVSRVSHELRTPLAAVEGLLETVIVRWDELTEDDRRLLLTRAHRASQRLSRLVATLLIHARIERTMLAASPTTVELGAAVEELLEELRETLPVEVEHRRTDGVLVRTDPDHVTRIVSGLLENAATYGRPPIVVETGMDGDLGTVVVHDHGDGVPAGFEAALFTPFAQASTGLRRTAQGLGLGLPIARGLAEANGGSVTLEPSRIGARFVLRLPLRTDAATSPR
jgi:PAS domain S-box-containing protein